MSALFSSVRLTASSRVSSSVGRPSGAGDASAVGARLGEGTGAWAKAGAADARSRANAARLTRIILTRPPTVLATLFVRAAAPHDDRGRLCRCDGRDRTMADPRL